MIHFLSDQKLDVKKLPERLSLTFFLYIGTNFCKKRERKKIHGTFQVQICLKITFFLSTNPVKEYKGGTQKVKKIKT